MTAEDDLIDTTTTGVLRGREADLFLIFLAYFLITAFTLLWLI